MLKKKDKYVVAVVGATGAVGNEMIAVLEERNFPVEQLRLFASERSKGKTLEYNGKPVAVEVLTESLYARFAIHHNTIAVIILGHVSRFARIRWFNSSGLDPRWLDPRRLFGCRLCLR